MFTIETPAARRGGKAELGILARARNELRALGKIGEGAAVTIAAIDTRDERAMRRAVVIQLRTHLTELRARIEHQVLLAARLLIGRALLGAGLRAWLLDGDAFGKPDRQRPRSVGPLAMMREDQGDLHEADAVQARQDADGELVQPPRFPLVLATVIDD